MAQKRIITGLLGAGRIGKMHAENIISSVPNAFLKAVADPKLDEDWAKNMDIPVRSRELDTLLSDPEIEAVVIATSSSLHVEMIKKVAAAGKHIFCEKPIAFKPELITEAIAAVRAAGVKLQVGFNRRFDPDFMKVQDAVESGRIGTTHIIKLTNRDPLRPSLDFIPNSGGLFMDFSIHDFDTVRYISHSEVEEIYATGAVLVDPKIGELGDIDTAMITIKLVNGSLCHIDLSRETHYGYDQQLEVFGSKGSVRARNTTPTNTMLTTANGVFTDKPHHSFVERYQEAFVNEMQTFFDCVEKNINPPVSGEDALAAVNMALAAQKSFEQNKPVRIA